MKDPIFELQEAIYARLTGATGVKYPVMDSIPDDFKKDFIEIQPVFSDYSPTGKKCPISINIFNLYCWSLYDGNKKISQMFNDIGNVLTFSDSSTYTPLTTTNFNICGSYIQDKTINKLPENEMFVRQGIMTIEIWTNEK